MSAEEARAELRSAPPAAERTADPPITIDMEAFNHSAAAYAGMARTDPQAVWLFQTWSWLGSQAQGPLSLSLSFSLSLSVSLSLCLSHARTHTHTLSATRLHERMDHCRAQRFSHPA